MRKLIFIALAILFVTLCGVVLLGLRQGSILAQILPRTGVPSPSSYDPAQYGLPKTIGSYKVLAVLTPENTECMIAGSRRLVLQASEENIPDYLNDSQTQEIQSELRKYQGGDIPSWEVMIVGPNTNLDGFISENEKWNKQAKQFGCVNSGPVGATATPR